MTAGFALIPWWTPTHELPKKPFGHFLDAQVRPASSPIPDVDPASLFDYEDLVGVHGIKTIVFSAMAIEAAAYDFAAIQLGDKVAKQYLDKMDIVGKWMIAPRLVCGRSLREDGPAVNGLNSLAAARNALVHHKSKEWDRAGKAVQAMKKRWASFEKDQVPNAFKTLILLSLELDAVLGITTGATSLFWKAGGDHHSTQFACRESGSTVPRDSSR